MTDVNSIGFHFIGLETRERAIFDRVIAFNITHGLKAHTANDSEHADLIVLSDTVQTQVEKYTNSKTLIVLSDDGSTEFGDIQIQRPLLITKVMNSLGYAIELAKAKLEENSSTIAESSEQVDDTTTKDQAETVAEVVENTVVEAETADNSEQSGHHALVIDDSASIRKQLELELRDAGITSDFAESGEMALEKIKDNHFDLIFLDIIMPGIDGYETCKAMRSTVEYKKTPIIMLSGKTSPLDEVQGVIAGATTYLTKPVKSDKLQETLNRVTKWINNFAESKKTETA